MIDTSSADREKRRTSVVAGAITLRTASPQVAEWPTYDRGEPYISDYSTVSGVDFPVDRTLYLSESPRSSSKLREIKQLYHNAVAQARARKLKDIEDIKQFARSQATTERYVKRYRWVRDAHTLRGGALFGHAVWEVRWRKEWYWVKRQYFNYPAYHYIVSTSIPEVVRSYIAHRKALREIYDLRVAQEMIRLRGEFHQMEAASDTGIIPWGHSGTGSTSVPRLDAISRSSSTLETHQDDGLIVWGSAHIGFFPIPYGVCGWPASKVNGLRQTIGLYAIGPCTYPMVATDQVVHAGIVPTSSTSGIVTPSHVALSHASIAWQGSEWENMGLREVLAQSAELRAGHLKRDDLSFIAARSLGELKDTKDTWTQGVDFLKFLRRPDVRARAIRASRTFGIPLGKFGASLKAAASAYLAWKFAIQPTVDDITHVIHVGKEAALQLHHSLLSVVGEMRSLGLEETTLSRYFRPRVPHIGSYPPDIGPFKRTGQLSITYTVELPIPTLCAYGCTLDLNASAYRSRPPIQATTVDDLTTRYRQARKEATIFRQVGNERQEYVGSVVYAGDPCQIVSDSPFTSGRAPTLPDKAFYTNIFQVVCGDFSRHLRNNGIRVPAVACLSQSIRGCIFGKYELAEIQRLFSGLGTYETMIDKIQPILTTWELLPLSFVIDWLTTWGDTIRVLNNFSTAAAIDLEPLTGFWASAHAEIRAHAIDTQVSVMANVLQPSLSWALDPVFDQGGVSEYGTLTLSDQPIQGVTSTEWAEIKSATRSPSVIHDLLAGAAYNPRISLGYSVDGSTSPGALTRTGLFRALRGPFKDPPISWALPRLRLNLNSSKIATLLAMFGFK